MHIYSVNGTNQGNAREHLEKQHSVEIDNIIGIYWTYIFNIQHPTSFVIQMMILHSREFINQ